jgi:cell division protein FtsI/penicillin-binding protein 2
MPNRIHRARCIIVLAVLLGTFVALGAKLFSIQVARHDFFVREALALHERTMTLYPARGRILDRNGKTLAMSEPTKIVCLVPPTVADPDKTKDPDALVARLADILGKPPEQIAAYALDESKALKYVQREVPEDVLERLEQLRSDRSFFEDVFDPDPPNRARTYEYPGILLKDRVRRVYPNGTLTAHVLGYVRHETEADKEIEPAVRDDKYPVAGIELTADHWLKGSTGWSVRRMDRRRREVLPDTAQGEAAIDGFDVVLTVDLNIQCLVEQAVAQAAERVACDTITVLVLRPQTGEILAWANWPTFDPNELTPETHTHSANAAIEEFFEPGSTLKPFSAVLALHYGTVTLDTEFDCERGRWRTPVGRVLHDAHPYETLSVFDIIKKSSNIGIAKVAATLGGPGEGLGDEQLAKERLDAGLRSFGFGRRTGLPLPLESPGLLRPLRDWSGYSMTSLPMGHEIGVTPLQLALAYGAIANGGTLMEPRIVARLLDQDGNIAKTFPPKAVARAVSAQAARSITQAMQAVAGEGGTAPRADIPGFSQAGKTGTSHKVIDGRYSNTVFDSTFVGFAPVGEPAVVILVTMRGTRKPNHYAGTVAAPVFAEIGRDVLQYLEVPPDEVAPRDDAHADAHRRAN